VYDENAKPKAALEGFLRECVDLLVSDSVYVRESAKEALGSELPLALFRLLIAQMTKSVCSSLFWLEISHDAQSTLAFGWTGRHIRL
jgi:neurofibromin 1